MPSARDYLVVGFVLSMVLVIFVSAMWGQAHDETKPTPTTIMGCVSKGVEAGCIVLTTHDGKTYSLHGDKLPDLGKGLGVTAKGTAGGMDTCQQGTVFQVSEWTWNHTKCPKDGDKK